jgi:cobalt-precorrin 5A hydrolase
MAPGHAGDAVGVGEAVIVAGIGCRKGVPATEIEAAIDAALERAGRSSARIDAALERAGRSSARIDAVATSMSKREEKGIAQAASARGVRLVFVAPADLEVAGARCATWSARVLALAGVPSVAEAAALAACGPKAKLILPRIVVGAVTCALASAEEGP